jgi:hypothetical protein
MRSKTLLHGIGKSRKGRPSISFQTLVDRTKMSAFAGVVKAAQISDEAALDAAKRLQEAPGVKFRRQAELGGLTAAAAPAIGAASRAVKGAIDAKKGRFGAARAAFRDTTRGGVVADAFRGGLTGVAIGTGRESLEDARAKRTVRQYVEQHGGR